MKKSQVIKRIGNGEDSQTQFKENFTNSEQLAAEMVGRKISREELLRLFQDSGHLAADEMIIYDASVEDLNLDKFRKFFKKNYGASLNETGLTFSTVRLRTYKTWGCCKENSILALVFKLVESASYRWQKLHSSAIIPLVLGGVKYRDGVMVDIERDIGDIEKAA